MKLISSVLLNIMGSLLIMDKVEIKVIHEGEIFSINQGPSGKVFYLCSDFKKGFEEACSLICELKGIKKDD